MKVVPMNKLDEIEYLEDKIDRLQVRLKFLKAQYLEEQARARVFTVRPGICFKTNQRLFFIANYDGHYHYKNGRFGCVLAERGDNLDSPCSTWQGYWTSKEEAESALQRLNERIKAEGYDKVVWNWS